MVRSGAVAAICVAALVLLAALVAALVAAPAHAIEIPASVSEASVDRIVRSMTVEEKVGQLLMVGFAGRGVNRSITRWVRGRRVGGVALFSRNIVDVDQVARFTRDLQDLTVRHVPIFVALDQEGGNVIRVRDGATLLPGNMALGATRSPTLAYVAGQALAIDLRRLGFNMNLAPVLDVNSNPSNPVIGIRSYGERPELVADLGAWTIRGQQEMGVVAVAKHFPGHGDTQSDSHFSVPSISADMQRLRSVELLPFQRAAAAGLDAVMTAHIAVPRISETPDVPATLSTRILDGLLRDTLGFDGVVITDGLEMRGIVEQYGSGRAAVLAVLAGADMPMILWTPSQKEEVYRSLLEAVASGEITRQRLDRSVRRILRVKARRGLFARETEPLARVVAQHNRNPIHAQVAEQIAAEAVTLVRNHGELLPLRSERYRRAVVVAPVGPFASRMAREPNISVITVAYLPSREQRRADTNRILRAAQDADLLVMAVVNRYHVEMVRALSRALVHTPTVLVSFASPYYLQEVPHVDAYVCTYSYLDVAQSAAAEAMLGFRDMTGRLPISIPGLYAYGHRVEPPAMGRVSRLFGPVR